MGCFGSKEAPVEDPLAAYRIDGPSEAAGARQGMVDIDVDGMEFTDVAAAEAAPPRAKAPPVEAPVPAKQRPQKQRKAEKVQSGKQAPGPPSGGIGAMPAGLMRQKEAFKKEDFMFIGRTGEECVRMPGQVKGQQFVIDNCTESAVFLLDHVDSVTIDGCVDCRFYIGPTSGSVFIRDCVGCTLVTVCRQLRTRDCQECTILLHCRSRPIIETSRRLRIGCADAEFGALRTTMNRCGLDPLHNFWSHVHDYSPAAADQPANWRPAPRELTSEQALMPVPLPAIEAGFATPEEPRVLLRINGDCYRARGSPSCVVLLPERAASRAVDVARSLVHAAGMPLLHTNRFEIPHQLIQAAASRLGVAPPALAGVLAYLEVEGSADDARAVLQQLGVQGAIVSDRHDLADDLRMLGIDGG
ncbi:unnamed protein product [Pedinophyceae sp. YPF-701]|nr:unnamed protein product [Pedinophyceae sp. YPF-701]